MEGRYDMYSQGISSWRTTRRNEEFQEEDVWSVVKHTKDYSSNKVGAIFKEEPSKIFPRPIPSATKIIPRAYKNPNIHTHEPPKLVKQSAPLNIPDWSKIYGEKPKASKNASWLHDGDCDDGVMRGSSWDSGGDDDDDGNGDMIPPHEWIAKKLARSQISSFSVCEGVGRTLKGRDLSTVRNAVLTKTGFLE